jgi:hypothetical protein
MNITTAGVDLAKNLFQVRGVDDRGNAVLRKALKRTEVVSFRPSARSIPLRSSCQRRLPSAASSRFAASDS